MKRYHKCFRCKERKIVGEEIARMDMHAVCYQCLGAKSQHHSSTLAASSPRGASVKSKTVRKSPGNHNRSPAQKPTE